VLTPLPRNKRAKNPREAEGAGETPNRNDIPTATEAAPAS